MNIFARELSLILAKHGKTLSSLYGLKTDTFQIVPNKVTRLRRSLWEDITATLNGEELEVLQQWVPLDAAGEELRRLRAALVAEAVRHLLGGRMPRDEALQLGDITFQMLLGQQPDQLTQLRDVLLESMRGDELLALRAREAPMQEDDPFLLETGMAALDPTWEPTIEWYEQGLLWLEIARQTTEAGARQGYLSQARTLLNLAREQALQVLNTAGTPPEQHPWLDRIDAALAQTSTTG